MTWGSASQAGWAWADHLRSGGATPWREWLAEHPSGEPDPAGRGTAPDAAHLELVRRLAARAGPGPQLRLLADRAFVRSGPGRGPSHLPLLLPDAPPPALGPRPVDPAELGLRELLRAGAGLLADLLVSHDLPRAPATRRRLPRPGRGFVLVGAPLTVAGLREGLLASGRREGGRRPDVLVLAEPFDLALAQVWSSRVQSGSPVRWAAATRRWARQDALPPAADLARTAARWADRVGADRVRVVTGPDVRRTAERALGGRAVRAAEPRPRALGAAASDVVRRVNRVLAVRLPEEAAARRRDLLVGMLPEGGGPSLALPPDVRRWARDTAAAQAAALGAGGYPVEGDLARVAPVGDGAPHPRHEEVLALTLDMTLRLADDLVRRTAEAAR